MKRLSFLFVLLLGGGCLFVLLFALVLFYLYRKDITRAKWLLWLAVCCIPVAYIVSEAGWLVAEFGRQPWTIQDMLPTWVGVSQIGSSAVMTTFLLFLILFTTLLAVEISIMLRAIKTGPSFEVKSERSEEHTSELQSPQ